MDNQLFSQYAPWRKARHRVTASFPHLGTDILISDPVDRDFIIALHEVIPQNDYPQCIRGERARD